MTLSGKEFDNLDNGPILWILLEAFLLEVEMSRWFFSILFVLGFAGSALASGLPHFQTLQPIQDSAAFSKANDLNKSNLCHDQLDSGIGFVAKPETFISIPHLVLLPTNFERAKGLPQKAYLFVFSGQSPPCDLG